jgi:pyrroline-5-carboxylate reductase
MGFALLKGWMTRDPALKVHVVEPIAELAQRALSVGANVVSEVEDLPSGITPALVVLAVKPQLVVPILKRSAALATSATTFVSVAAGITIAAIASALPFGAPVIRCMPNTPASIGQGLLALCAGESVSPAAASLTESLFSASGAVAWIEREDLMDAVTAISGSGPAYVFHFIEALTQAGQALGLPPETAVLLAKKTVSGAGQMAMQTETPASELRAQVTSPNGTTAAALNVFMADQALVELVARATLAARDRGIELGAG